MTTIGVGGSRAVALAIVVAALIGCGSLAPPSARDCHAVAWIPGPEDLELDTTDARGPRLLVSSFERRHDAGDGRIVAVPLRDRGFGEPRVLTLTGRDGRVFAPHGIALARTSAGPRLYVINHPAASEHAVEVFAVDGDRLVFERRLMSPLLVDPNDLVARDDGQIYVTNTGASGLGGALGFVLGLRRGTVVHFRNGTWQPAVADIGYANGIAIDPRGDVLYVAGFRDQAIHVFRRTGAAWRREEPIHVGSGVDNLTWADDDTLIAAAHPSLSAFMRHWRDGARRAPTEVYRIDVRRRRAPERIYTDQGAIVSAASTAILRNGWLYMGQVFDPQVVGCPLP